MSEELEKSIDFRVQRLFPIVWTLLAAAFGGVVWGATLQFKVAQLESKAVSNETRLSRIEFYVIQIAEKVGVKVEPPRG